MSMSVEKTTLNDIKRNANENNVQDKLATLIDYGTNSLRIDMKALLYTKFDIIPNDEAYSNADNQLSEDQANGDEKSVENDEDNLSALNHDPSLQGYVYANCSPVTATDLDRIADYLLKNL